MADLSVRQTQGAGALSAEHYQSFEMAKANDSILGGDDIAQIRGYAARIRAEAQVLHKRIASMKNIEDIAATKAEMLESEQTLARVSIYADQRIGELLRELPKGNKWVSNSPTGENEKTKTEAIKDMGISNKTAYDLEALAANPEIVQAVIERAEAEGRVPSRSQVTQAIRERDIADRQRRAAEQTRDEARQENDELKSENAKLRRKLAETPEPEVIKEEVIKEIVVKPDDYDDLKRRVSGLESENRRILNENQGLRDSNLEKDREIERRDEQLGERERNNSANRDVEQLVNNIYTFLDRHGGKSRAFDQFHRVDESTQQECRKAIVALGGFAQSLLAMVDEVRKLGA